MLGVAYKSEKESVGVMKRDIQGITRYNMIKHNAIQPYTITKHKILTKKIKFVEKIKQDFYLLKKVSNMIKYNAIDPQESKSHEE